MRKIDAYRLHLIRAGLDSLAHTLVWTAMMLYQIEVVGLTPLQLVLLGTIMEITVFLFEVPTGIVADLRSRRLSVIIGTLMIGGSYLLQGAIPLFEALVIGQVIWGIGFTFTSGAYDAWLVDEIGQERAGGAFIRGGQVARILALVGIGATMLLGSVGLHIPVLVGGAIILVSGVVMRLVMPETGFHPTPRPDRNTFQQMFDTFRDGVRVVRGRPTLISILLIGLFIGLYSEAWDRLWQAHLLENIGLPTFVELPSVVWFGVFNIISMILGIGAAEIMRRRLDMNNSRVMRRALFGIVAVMVTGLVVYALGQSFMVAILAFFVFTAMRGLSEPIFVTWSNQNIDSNVRATVLSLQSQTDAIGQMAGGPPLGVVGQASMRLAFLASAGLLTPVLGLLMWAGRREQRQAQMAAAVEPSGD